MQFHFIHYIIAVHAELGQGGGLVFVCLEAWTLDTSAGAGVLQPLYRDSRRVVLRAIGNDVVVLVCRTMGVKWNDEVFRFCLYL